MPELLLHILAVIGHVLLAILKILLIVLIVVLVLILLLLFAPFTYRADIHKHGDRFYGRASLTWLLFVFRLRDRFENGNNELDIYVLGIPISRIGRFFKEKKHKGGGHGRERAAENGSSGVPEPSGEPEAPSPDKKSGKTKSRAGKRTGSASPSKLKVICGKIKRGFQILRDEKNKAAFGVIREHGLNIIRHIFPSSIEGYLEFGFDDPSQTGEALGVLSWILPVIPEKFQIIPDFTEKKLETDAEAKGHFFVFVLLKEALRIWLNKDVKKLIRRVRNDKEKSGH